MNEFGMFPKSEVAATVSRFVNAYREGRVSISFEDDEERRLFDTRLLTLNLTDTNSLQFFWYAIVRGRISGWIRGEF
jgi:hypothetical protein